VGRKDKGRKGENGKGKGRKHDRARNDAVAAEAAKGDTTTSNLAAFVEAPPKVEARPTTPRTRVATAKVAAPRTAAPRTPARRVAAPKVERELLPADRASLIDLHQAARRRRDAAPLMSAERAEASFEIERIEVQVARIERAMDPPLV
jgi:hypothetical protein